MSTRIRSGQNSQETTAVSSVHKQQRQSIVVAIPCFNEELFIGSVVLKTMDYADSVLVIDDGSTDNTAIVAEKAGATVIGHGHNCGKGAAVRTAFEHAREMSCEALVLLDGDGQHDPGDVPSLVAPVLAGDADMVVGSRYLETMSAIPGYRVIGHKILNFFTNLGSKVKLTDSQSGLRAFSPKAIQSFQFSEEGLSVESEMQFLANEAGLKVMETPVSIGYHGFSKRSPLAHGMGVLNSILGLIGKRIPLFFFGLPGLVMLAFGVWEGWRVVEGYNTYNDFYIGPALLAVLLCIVGSLSLFTGLILYTIRSFFNKR